MSPVLLIVMDGMSWPTWVELAADLPRLGWDEACGREGRTDASSGSRLFPARRRSPERAFSLAGCRSGTAKDETKGFAAALAGKAAGAILFHKAELIPEGGGNVAPDVLAAIADTKRRAVGVVINEIDDALAGGMQADRRFRIPEIGPLMTCLEAARNAGRVCVVTSDHGHVLEYEGAYRSSGGTRPALASRLRRSRRGRDSAGGSTGARRRRRCGRTLDRAGALHGREERRLPRWGNAAGDARPGGCASSERASHRRLARGRARSPRVVGRRCAARRSSSLPPRRPAETLLDVAAAEPEWIERLLESPVYATQRERHARVAVDDERARRILSVLALRGDRATTVAVAKALDVPEYRARGMLSGLRRVLAVDGFDVLAVHEEDVTLDRPLLFQQFGLGTSRVGMSTMSAARRQSIVDALRRGTVPRHGLDALAVGLDRFETAIDADLETVAARRSELPGGPRASTAAERRSSSAGLQSARGGAGSRRARSRFRRRRRPCIGHETVYRRIVERLSTPEQDGGALRGVLDAWFYALEEDIACGGRGSAQDDDFAGREGQ